MAVYEIITNRIIEQLDKGVIPWQRPWGDSPLPRNLVSGKEYRGINILLLSFTEYKSPYWLTYKQAKDLKCHVKAGEKGLPVVYYNMVRVNGSEDEEKSKEELIAEIGASFLCAITGIENKTIANQASYISSWLNRLKNDKKLIITAASHAQKAVDYILSRKAA